MIRQQSCRDEQARAHTTHTVISPARRRRGRARTARPHPHRAAHRRQRRVGGGAHQRGHGAGAHVRARPGRLGGTRCPVPVAGCQRRRGSAAARPRGGRRTPAPPDVPARQAGWSRPGQPPPEDRVRLASGDVGRAPRRPLAGRRQLQGRQQPRRLGHGVGGLVEPGGLGAAGVARSPQADRPRPRPGQAALLRGRPRRCHDSAHTHGPFRRHRPTPHGGLRGPLRLLHPGAVGQGAPTPSQDWSGGNRIAIHSTPETETIGEAVSHGCVRLTLAEGQWLINHIPLGTPAVITS